MQVGLLEAVLCACKREGEGGGLTRPTLVKVSLASTCVLFCVVLD